MRILGIDPGPYDSAYVIWDGTHLLEHGFLSNVLLQQRLSGNGYDEVAIEWITCYGKVVGKDVFRTCAEIGRFDHERTAQLIERREIRLHLCDTARAGDPQVRRALLDRFGEQGTKKNPGVLYGIKGHEWSALAVAVVEYEKAREKEREMGAK